MAEGGRGSFTACSYKGSEEVFDFNCTPCAQDGNYIEAIVFCTDCVELFCSPCNKQHKRFGVTSGHKVISADQADQATSLLPTERCSEHTGERISTFCVEHDVVICSKCLALDHRACKGASYIPKIAGSPEQSKERQQIKDEISETLKAMGQIKVSIHDRKANIDTEKKVHVQQINDYTGKIIEHAKALQKTAFADVDEHHKKATNGLQTQIKSVDEVTAKMKDRLKKLDNTHVSNGSQTFVDIKRGKKEVQAATKLQDCLTSSSLGQGNAIFAVDDSVHIFLNDVKSLGNVIRTKPYKVVLEGRYDIGLEEEEYTCIVPDIYELSDGKILVVDGMNSSIKLLNRSYDVSKSFQLPTYPWGICQTSLNEVAVTLLYDKKVQFVDLTGEWKLTRSFNVEDNCRAITLSNDELFVSCGGHQGSEKCSPEGPGFVGIYGMSGTIIQKIQFDLHGRQIFSVPYHIATTSNGKKIHIADSKNGLVTLNRRGNVLSKCSKNIQKVTGVCAVSDDSLIVCGFDSNNIVQIDTSGNVVAKLASRFETLVNPLSVTLARGRSKLFVSFDESDEISIYDFYSE